MFGTWALRIALALALVLAFTTPAQAYSGCTNASLFGTYGLQFSGVITPDVSSGVVGAALPDQVMSGMNAETPGTLNYTAGVARIYLDGAGSLFGNSTVTVNGTTLEGPLSGTYSVNDDCTAAITVADAASGTQHFDAVVVNRGDGAMLRQTDKGIAVAAAMSRALNSCDPTAVLGYFGFRTSGTIINSGPFTSIGSLFADPAGKVAVTESRFTSGAPSQVLSTGDITISPDCSITLSIASSVSGGVTTYRGMLVNNLKELILVGADAGVVVTSNMVVQ